MTQNEHVYAICCRLEVAGDVISGENVNIEDYAVLVVSEILKKIISWWAMAVDINDSIKRKRIRTSLKNVKRR